MLISYMLQIKLLFMGQPEGLFLSLCNGMERVAYISQVRLAKFEAFLQQRFLQQEEPVEMEEEPFCQRKASNSAQQSSGILAYL